MLLDRDMPRYLYLRNMKIVLNHSTIVDLEGYL